MTNLKTVLAIGLMSTAVLASATNNNRVNVANNNNKPTVQSVKDGGTVCIPPFCRKDSTGDKGKDKQTD
jgi:hypothetical protein